jgi:hypothetical protein
MSLSETIDTQYRLHPADLGGRARTVFVARITFDGVEELTPLVHFEGMARPLALDAQQRIQMAHIARSALLADWIGMALVLRPVRAEGEETIRLHGLEDRIRVQPVRAWHSRRPFAPVSRRTVLRTALVVLLVAALVATISAVERVENLDALLDVFGF